MKALRVKTLIINLLPPPIKLQFLTASFLKNSMNSEIWGGGTMSEKINEAFINNLSNDELKDAGLVNKLTRDIVWCYIVYGSIPEEYFVFEFRHKNKRQREEYLTNKFKDLLLIDKIGWDKIMRLRDKFETYNLLGQFFKRDVIKIASENDKECYMSFIKKHPRYFAKPIDGMCGKGAAIMEGNRFAELLSSGEWVIEEIVEQVREMSIFNDTSVNTVRLPTFYHNGKFTPLAPFLRTGRKGSLVDNGGAGGVFAAIDEKTGTVISDGLDENNKSYTVHPDSSVKFSGFQLPQWKELLAIAEEAHKKLSDQRYIAWDFAFTPKGWVMIEANSAGQFLWQYATKIGLKKKFLSLMN